MKPDPSKLDSVRNFSVPRKQRNIRKFLGLTGYYRRFIKNYSTIAKPLTKLLEKGVEFHSSADAQNAFDKLKDALCTAPILQYPDFTKPFIITTDASGTAIGAVSSQGEIGKDRPVAYYSRVLRGPEIRYDTYEKEAVAIVQAVKNFRPYIYMRPFTVVTDHKPLVWYKTAKDGNARILKWRLRLAEYEYDVIHKPGKINSNADVLSRNPVETVHITTRAQKEKEKNLLPLDDRLQAVVDHHSNSEEARKEPPNLLKPPAKDKGRHFSSEEARKEPPNLLDSPAKDKGRHFEAMERPGRPPEWPKAPTRPGGRTPKRQEKLTDKEIISNSLDPEESDPDTEETSSDSESDCSIEEVQISEQMERNKQEINIIIVKDLFQYRKKNLVFFLDENGHPCDEGSRVLQTQNNFPKVGFIDTGQVYWTKKGGKNYFGLIICGSIKESSLRIKSNIAKVLVKLKGILRDKSLKSFSLAYSKYVENIPWKEVLSLIHEIYVNEKTKVIICLGTIRYVPREERDQIFFEAHKSPIGGHKGVSKTFNRIRINYYWENLKQDIQNRIQQCLECQLKKLVRVKTRQPMLITDTPGTVFEKIPMDIVGPLPVTEQENGYILTIQDQLSKFCVTAPLRNMLAITVADTFIRRFVCILGAPKALLTDQGRNFISTFMQRISKRFKIKKIQTTAFRPQSNGSLERSHHVLGEYLKQFVSKDSE